MSDMQFDGFDAYDMDENLEAGEGVRVEYDDGRAFVLHRAGGANKKFARVMQAKTKPHTRKIQAGTMPDSVADRLLAEVYAESVIIGWDGITAGGKPVPFNTDNVVAFLLAKPEVFTAIQRDAQDLSVFRRAENEAAAKN